MDDSNAPDPDMPLMRVSLRRFLNWRRLLLIAFLLLCAMGIFQLRSSAPSNPDAPTSERRRAILQASALLLDPGAARSVRISQPIRSASDPFAAEPPGGGPNAVITAGRATETASRQMESVENVGTPTNGQTHNQAFESVSPSAVAKSNKGSVASQSLATHTDGARATISPALRRATRNTIPAQIEDGMPVPDSRDALAGLTVINVSGLRVEVVGRFRLAAIRVDDGRPRAKIIDSDAPPGTGTATRWYGSGDSPGPGWRVLSISTGKVVLIDPKGTRVELTDAINRTLPNSEALPPAGRPLPAGSRR